MAFSMHAKRKTAMSEINVTPLVDVMLVLLIIFMVTAPMMQTGLPVDVPKAPGQTLEPDPKAEPAVIAVTEKGLIEVNGSTVTEDKLVQAVLEAIKQDPKRGVYLRGDQGVPYGNVARIMGALVNAGITNLSLITSPQEESAPAK
jgi:biopolymer transport protein TolR